jgi:hypothetical protein
LNQRVFLFRDDGALWSHLGVEFDEAFPILRDVVLMENRFDRTLGDAGFAIDAFIRVDVDDFVAFVETFDGTNDDAIRVLTSETWFADDVCHDRNLRDNE